MNYTLKRWVQVDGREVSWGNVIGPYSGQSETWVFGTEAKALRFAEYAKQDPAPSLAFKDLSKLHIPLPIERTAFKRNG